MTRTLLLGGTSEASRLAEALAARGADAVFSYAGRVATPAPQPLPTRIGGFGGVEGLVDYIRREGISRIVDATHPFAASISRNAIAAAAQTHTPLIGLERAPWVPEPADLWLSMPDLAAAAAYLPQASQRVFLAIGRQHLDAFAVAPQHSYLLRLVDPPEGPLPLATAEAVIARGPFTLEGDRDLLIRHRIDWIVTKNSGGEGARAKLMAARELRLPVLMVQRPELPPRKVLGSVGEVLDWLDHSAPLTPGT